MRAYLLLLLAVLTLLGSSNGTSASANNLHPLKNHIQSTNAALRTGRLLRTEATTDQAIDPDDEERGIADVAKKLGTRSKNWASDKILAADLYLKAVLMNLDNSVQKLLKRGVNPNRVYRVLKLSKKSNRKIDKFETGEYRLWKQLKVAYKQENPGWVSAY